MLQTLWGISDDARDSTTRSPRQDITLERMRQSNVYGTAQHSGERTWAVSADLKPLTCRRYGISA